MIKGNPKICPIHLFFNYKLMPKELIPFGFRHDFIIPDFGATQKH
jgi:hypothetical protein